LEVSWFLAARAPGLNGELNCLNGSGVSASRSPLPNDQSIGGSWAFYGLVLILVAAPLPFGGVYQWTWAGLAVLVALLLLVSTPSYLIRVGALPRHQTALWLPASLYFLVVAWTMLQASGLTPESWNHPVWAQTADVLGERVVGSISLNPYATWSESVKMLTYAGGFWLAVVYGRDRFRARFGLWALGIVGCLYAAYGLTAYLTDLGSTLWLHKMPVAYAGVSSTFVNRNMYVDYAGFGLLAVVCLILSTWLSNQRYETETGGGWRGLMFGKNSYVLLLYTMGLILLTAVTMTGSRGGVLVTAIAVGALVYLSARLLGVSRMSRGRLLTIVLIVAAVVILVYGLAGAFLAGRLADTTAGTGAGRIAGYRMILRAIGEAPLTGYGAGNSLDVFYLYNDGTMWGAFNYAHSIYLGAVVELGLPAAALLFASVGLVAFHCLKGIDRRGRDQVFPALGVSATVLVAVHGLFDSPLYLAANAATFSFLLGLAYAQSWPTRPTSPTWQAEEPPDRNDRALQEPAEAQSG
jgi:O-antigen ligase